MPQRDKAPAVTIEPKRDESRRMKVVEWHGGWASKAAGPAPRGDRASRVAHNQPPPPQLMTTLDPPLGRAAFKVASL